VGQPAAAGPVCGGARSVAGRPQGWPSEPARSAAAAWDGHGWAVAGAEAIALALLLVLALEAARVAERPWRRMCSRRIERISTTRGSSPRWASSQSSTSSLRRITVGRKAQESGERQRNQIGSLTQGERMYCPELPGLVRAVLLARVAVPCGLQADSSGDWQGKAVSSSRPRPPEATASALAMVEPVPQTDQPSNQPAKSRGLLQHPAVFGAML
jgi:hypothetical protein